VVKQTKELAGKTHVKPLKPPPNPALRSLWRAIAAVAVLATIGASVWLFRPWEAFDPAARAKAERDSSIAKLAAFGIQPEDLEVFDWKAIAKKRLEPDGFDALKLEADSGNTVAQAVLCAAAYWGTPTREPDDQLAFTNCRLSAEAGEAAGQVYYGYLLEERSRYISGETEEEKERKRTLSADASEQFRKASEQGFGWGQLEYGARLLSGEGGVATDPARAAELYRSAQAKQMPAADYAMAELVSMGYLANNSARWTEAARLYRAAADKGFPPAMYELADMLRDGRGIPEDLEAALALYRQAAAQDDNEAVADRARSQVDYHERKKAEAAEAAAMPPP
jgi:TPR repeat protein